MSFGKLYGFADNARSVVLLAVAKANKLDIELVDTRPPNTDPEYRKLNPLNRVPTFVGKNGFVLSEVIAIAIYFASQQENSDLLGKSKEDYASIVRWMSFSNSELFPSLGGWFRPLIGKDPYDEERVKASRDQCLKTLDILESHLSSTGFLVGNDLTLADLLLASQISRGFQFVLDKEWRAENVNLTRWYETVVNKPVWKAVVENPVFVEKDVQYSLAS